MIPILLLIASFFPKQIPLVLDMEVTVIESDNVKIGRYRVELLKYKNEIYFGFNGSKELFKIVDFPERTPGAYETFIVKNIKTGNLYTYNLFMNGKMMMTFTNQDHHYPLWMFKF